MVCDGDGTSGANFRFIATNSCEQRGGQCKHSSTSAYNRGGAAKLASWTTSTAGEPQQVHMISGHPETITIVYVTSHPMKSLVEVREASSKDDVTEYNGTWRTYTSMNIMGAGDAYQYNTVPAPASDIVGCGEGANGWAGYKDPKCIYESPAIHTVHITGLKPGTKYEHRPHGRKNWASFKTMPAIGEPISFGVIADVGATVDSLKTMQHLEDKLDDDKINAILFGGDLSYADGWGDMWDHWGRLSEFLMERAPTAYTVGNHEFANEQYAHYLQRFPAPAEARSVSDTDLYYSFEAGMAHVIMLCSYCRTEKNSSQYRFLESDLESVNRSRTPWVLVMTHVPWYTSNAHHTMDESTKMREAMEDLLYAHKVDAMLVGHLHAYERTYAIHSNSSVCDGIPHFTIGDGGNFEGPACPWWQKSLPDWEARREFSFGHGVFDIVNATHARWSWHRNQDGAAKVADSLWLQPASFGKGGGNPTCQEDVVL